MRRKILMLIVLSLELALAKQGVMVVPPVVSRQRFDGFIYVLEDSVLCDTCMCQDSRGIWHQVFVDSGTVLYQFFSAGWTSAVRLSPGRGCSSPLVFEMREPGEEPRLVVIWREEVEGRIEVFCRFRYPRGWGMPLCVTLHRN